jgi:glycosyltransferase involved in cell wall biosynthesis
MDRDDDVINSSNMANVSVVIPCYNSAGTVARAIRSVQRCAEAAQIAVKIVVVDDGSTDDSAKAIQAEDALYIRQENAGPARARNRGLFATSTDWVLFLDADDYWDPPTSAVLRALEEDGRVGIAHDLLFFQCESDLHGLRARFAVPTSGLDPENMLSWLLKGSFVPSNAIAWRRAFLTRIGCWRSLLRDDDGELMLRAFIEGGRARTLPIGLAVYCHNDSGDRVSRRTGENVLRERLNVLDELSLHPIFGQAGLLQQSLGEAYYRLAYEAYASSFDGLGRVAENSARKRGFKGQLGGRRRQILARVLGLRSSVAIASWLRKWVMPTTAKIDGNRIRGAAGGEAA